MGALRDARRRHGGSTPILQDGDGEPIGYDRLIQAAYALGGRLARKTRGDKAVGVLLPTAAPAVIAVFALHAAGRTPAMLNFTAGAAHIRAACELADVKTVVTSRRFIEAAGLEALAESLETDVELVRLEDVRAEIGALDKLVAGVRAALPDPGLARTSPDDPAVLLFTSGTTGTPKGVALSHANILANIAQCRAHIPFDPDWVFFNALPIFHGFGLTGGVLLPILGGMKTVLHPSPLDRKLIPELIAKTGANVLVSTDTFARYYARAADKDALEGLRYVVLGGERMSDATKRLFARKSSAAVLQGYGLTECGPVIAVNQPDADRPGTVGRLLPGMKARLERVPGIKAGARLLVRGPNIMLGYLDPERRGAVEARTGRWFDTEDLAEVDSDGFITVTGRIKRFAKIGGEMVSLDDVESCARALWPDAHHAAIALHADRKGEAIVLVTDQSDADREAFGEGARERGCSRLVIPSRIRVVDDVPLLATGKPDYTRVRNLFDDDQPGNGGASASVSERST
ncbi:2-acylglycerophosphoethanolamine acyltransferase [Marinicauda salina]|uniref:2-acylglycerophosphoethanolamine acyltransferase n=1 Tax=Marinicauda salina TaxID=2135793 RepID=A0A2U2BY72_9PROT|nr:2-acylglycerophosphoethanolamine acyltransferase [Marinicauda salina]